MLNNKIRSLIFACNISVVCNKLHVVLNNESENKMKAIKFVFSILRQTYPIIAHLWYPWNEHSKTNLGYIELLIYRSIYSGPLDFDISKFYCMWQWRYPLLYVWGIPHFLFTYYTGLCEDIPLLIYVTHLPMQTTQFPPTECTCMYAYSKYQDNTKAIS